MKMKRAFYQVFCFGNKQDLSEEIKTNFEKSSLSHVLAISGMHVIYVIGAVSFILDKLIYSKKIKNVILIIFLSVFCIFVGSSPSCLRACIMMIVLLVSQNLYRKNDFFSSWCLAFSIILCMNFYNIENTRYVAFFLRDTCN